MYLRNKLFAAIALMSVCLLPACARPPAADMPPGQAAAELMRAGMKELRAYRAELGLSVDAGLDPANSGLIGVELTDITTTLGELSAKQTSLNPAFATLIVAWLQEAGVQPGDKVAVYLTGSFPGLNLAALAACASLRLDAIVTGSVGSSSFGANIPAFTWLDMEKRLHSKGLIPYLTSHESLGGIIDTYGGLDGTGYELGEAAIARHGAIYLREGGIAAIPVDAPRRMAIYTRGGKPKAFINIGGGITPLGWISEAAYLGNGLLTSIPPSDDPARGLIHLMYELGVPVIHLINTEAVAKAHKLPIAPADLGLEEPGHPELSKQ